MPLPASHSACCITDKKIVLEKLIESLQLLQKIQTIFMINVTSADTKETILPQIDT